MLMTTVATNKKSTNTNEYTIKYLFNTFTMSLMTSFYKEIYELSVINKKKSVCSGVHQSRGNYIKPRLENLAKNKAPP